MGRFRTRRRRRRLRPGALVPVAVAAAVAAWWFYLRMTTPPGPGEALAVEADPGAEAKSAERLPGEDGSPMTAPSTGTDRSAARALTAANRNSAANERFASLLAAGKQALEQGDLLTARARFNEAYGLGGDVAQRSFIQSELSRLGDETIFSARVLPDDPYVGRYIIQPGDTLGGIAKANKVSAALLASINNIKDVNRIRAGQTIKTIKGPFRAVVDKSDYTVGVYLGDTLVRQFKVGLGSEGSTPSGVWRVGTKLKNPTYYPPRGGKVIAADDPLNPLGERWIGLVGVSGGAVGQLRYGLHGTIDPDSIGRSVSMGCIRMHNDDVEALFTYLVENHSTVTVQD